jgi:hypothetical protein
VAPGDEVSLASLELGGLVATIVIGVSALSCVLTAVATGASTVSLASLTPDGLGGVAATSGGMGRTNPAFWSKASVSGKAEFGLITRSTAGIFRLLVLFRLVAPLLAWQARGRCSSLEFPCFLRLLPVMPLVLVLFPWT